MYDAFWPSGAIAAEFDDEADLIGAVKALRRRGYSRVEAYSPYPVDALDRLVPERRSRLPWITFVAGGVGAVAGYLVQWYANAVSYPLNLGGRPAHATPAFMIPAFEATVLCASLAAFAGLLWSLGLPRPWHPMFEADGFVRASNDRFWVAVDATDAAADRIDTPSELVSLGAVRVVHVPPLE